jgi:predicted Ser/Thr protein kinase
MLKIDLKALDPVIKKYVEEFYVKPKDTKTPDSTHVQWFRDVLGSLINKHHIAYELAHLETVRIPSGDDEQCIKKPLKIKSVVEFGHIRKAYVINDKEMVTLIPFWIDDIKSKPNQLQTYIDNTSNILKKLGEIGVGPRVFDTYVCYSGTKTLLAVRMEYVKGRSISDLKEKGELDPYRDAIVKLITEKFNKMHENNITHGSYLDTKTTVVIFRNKKPVDIRFMDMSECTDLSKAAEEAVKKDERELTWFVNEIYNYKNTDPDSITNYVISRMIDDRKLVITPFE